MPVGREVICWLRYVAPQAPRTLQLMGNVVAGTACTPDHTSPTKWASAQSKVNPLTIMGALPWAGPVPITGWCTSSPEGATRGVELNGN